MESLMSELDGRLKIFDDAVTSIEEERSTRHVQLAGEVVFCDPTRRAMIGATD